jgi:hypothetical protein
LNHTSLTDFPASSGTLLKLKLKFVAKSINLHPLNNDLLGRVTWSRSETMKRDFHILVAIDHELVVLVQLDGAFRSYTNGNSATRTILNLKMLK